MLTRTTTVPLAPEAAFAWIVDPANAPRWLALVDRLEPEAGGPIGVATRLRIHGTARGRPFEQVTEVATHEPPRSFALRTRNGGFDATFAYTLEPEGDGTRVTFRLGVRPETFAAWLTWPLVVRGARARLWDRLERLQGAVRASSTVPPRQA